MNTPRAAILGAGSWGTALAVLLAHKGWRVSLWARSQEKALELSRSRYNRVYLPDVSLPEAITVTHDLSKALDGAELVVCTIPSHGFRDFLSSSSSLFPPNVPIVTATKGIESPSLRLPSQLIEEFIPEEQHRWITCLGGPSFAREVAAGVPTAVCLASRNVEIGEQVQAMLSTERFRVYTTDDIIGVELGGALKNVIAIAVGIADGLHLGHNARAALITRGLAEMSRLGTALGAHPLTFAGLSGIGDLVLTCTGDLSRNRNVGLELGRGKTLQEILGPMSMVAEGVRSARSAFDLAQREQVDIPVIHEVYRVLYEDKSPIEAVGSLMNRPPRKERG